jgi:hypothetical protein
MADALKSSLCWLGGSQGESSLITDQKWTEYFTNSSENFSQVDKHVNNVRTGHQASKEIQPKLQLGNSRLQKCSL